MMVLVMIFYVTYIFLNNKNELFFYFNEKDIYTN